MDLKAIAESRLAHELGSRYSELFAKTHKIKPVLSAEDNATFSWLASKLSERQARAVVEGLFLTQIRYVLESMHPVSALRKHLNAFLAVGELKNPRNEREPNASISVKEVCDRCGEGFLRVGSGNYKGPLLCDPCAMMPPPSITDLEEILKTLTYPELADGLREMVSKAIANRLEAGEFGRFCSQQIKRKLKAEFPGLDWVNYSNAVYIAAYLIADSHPKEKV